MKWTAAHDRFLVKHYADSSTAWLSAQLNRSARSIYCHARELGLAKSRAYILKNCRIQPGQNLGVSNRFRKGQPSWNKVMKQTQFLSAEGMARTMRTRFVKGNKPHNTLNGTGIIRTRKSKGRPYQYIKLADGVWKELHKVIWEQHHGPIPPNHNVQFKDRNSLNCTIENLYLITKRENMINNTIHRYPQPVKRAIKAVARLNRTIRTYEKQN